MQTINKNYLGVFLLLLLLAGSEPTHAQDKKTLNLSLAYYLTNNNTPYLVVTTKAKTDGKFQPVKGMEVKLFLDKDTTGHFIGKIITNNKGQAAVSIPPSLKSVWDANAKHTFLAISAANKEFDETSTDLSPNKARIILDTADDKNITATVTEFKDSAWAPVKGLELKIGVKRLCADLPVSDEQSFTTDSLGHVKAEFKKVGLPGDAKGNIILVARVEDNDQFGNLRVEKTVPWGTKFVPDTNFFVRALWGTRFRTPLWLLFMAYSIVFSVWGILIYLIALLIKVKKIGKEGITTLKH